MFIVTFWCIWGYNLVSLLNFLKIGITLRFWDIRLQKCHDLENRVKGPWRSFKMSPFDREPVTSYWCSTVTTALSRVVSEIFNVEKYRNLEIRVKGQSRLSEVVPFDRLGMVFYSNSVPKICCFWDIWLQKWCDLENWVRGPSRSLKISPCDKSAYDFLLTFHSNHGPILYCFRDRLQFQSKITKLEWCGYRADKEVLRNLQPCGYNAPTWQEDGHILGDSKDPLTHSVVR